jgi:predicted NodU family carbamoyl transferase
MMDALCLTLGHNSSAILIRNGKILGGYETERLTKVKADSSFPELPIKELYNRFSIEPDVEIMVGHWSLDGTLESMVKKHWNPEFIKTMFPKASIQSLGPTFTHHDSHAYSAMCFAGPEFPREPVDNSFVFVMDGFGTFGEHMSAYKLYGNVAVLQWRKFGFGTSMGLFYQYTTGYLGMKQNQDEYKLLAYEAYIEDAKSYIDNKQFELQISKWSDHFCQSLDQFETDPSTDPLISISALPMFAHRVVGIHDSVLDAIGFHSDDIRMKRIIVAYFTQSVVEAVVSYVVHMFSPSNVILSGGLFYNVKVNSMVSRQVRGKTCVMPLAGDQGAALGIYHSKYGLKWPGHLYWGPRDLTYFPASCTPTGLFIVDNDHAAMDLADTILRNDGQVNVIRGAMEFGPRALCHTSTLAKTNKGTCDYINHLNDRTHEMPFAPVVSPGRVSEMFEDVDKIHKSLEYMIITRDYKPEFGEKHPGAAHWDVNRGLYTGRPQVTHDPEMVRLLQNHKILVNTSYNYHGVPIVYDWNDILNTHNKQLLRVVENHHPSTVVVTGEIE